MEAESTDDYMNVNNCKYTWVEPAHQLRISSVLTWQKLKWTKLKSRAGFECKNDFLKTSFRWYFKDGRIKFGGKNPKVAESKFEELCKESIMFNFEEIANETSESEKGYVLPENILRKTLQDGMHASCEIREYLEYKLSVWTEIYVASPFLDEYGLEMLLTLTNQRQLRQLYIRRKHNHSKSYKKFKLKTITGWDREAIESKIVTLGTNIDTAVFHGKFFSGLDERNTREIIVTSCNLTQNHLLHNQYETVVTLYNQNLTEWVAMEGTNIAENDLTTVCPRNAIDVEVSDSCENESVDGDIGSEKNILF